jgi:large subunit ribosomal protein L25
MIENLSATPREDTGKEKVKRLRAGGKVPAVLYGKGVESRSLTLDARELETVLEKAHVVNVSVEGDKGKVQALVKEVQRDPVQVHLVLHVDLHEIKKGETIHVNVPVRALGQPIGLTEGGIFAHELREVVIETLPEKLPDEFVVDVRELHVGDGVLVGDLELPEGVAMVSNPKQLILHVVAPRGGLEDEDADGEGADGEVGEVEVIAKGKEEE